jgi:hypothetical protein
MACAICDVRRPRRFCPGVRGDICTICCGTEREVTVDCPLDCEYLQESRRHEKPPTIDPEQFPNRDIQISESFLAQNEDLLVFLSRMLLDAALETAGVVDSDVREALDGLTRTYRTLQSGVYYESVPTNPLAANIHRELQSAVEQFRKEETQRLGIPKTRDTDILGLLVFLQHLELDRNNGRRRGRAFLDALRSFYPPEPESGVTPPSSLILP